MHFIRDVIAQSAIAVKKIPAMDNEKNSCDGQSHRYDDEARSYS